MDIAELDLDLRVVRRGLREAGVPAGVVAAIATRALRAPRRKTGAYPANREARWTLNPSHPDYGTEEDCKAMLLRLYGMMLEFRNAPEVDVSTKQILEKYLGKRIERGTYEDALTLERLDYGRLAAGAAAPVHGLSDIHLGHVDPASMPKHTPENVGWRTERSNLIQGNQTLEEARTRIVEIIARYFRLGEVAIEKEE